MSARREVMRFVPRAAVVLIIAVCIIGCATKRTAEISTPAAPAENCAAIPERAVAAPNSTQESIKVHGQWSIEVHNPDGTLVAKRDFHNALVLGGSLLTMFLSRAGSVGVYQVELFARSSTAPQPCGATLPDGVCAIIEPGSPVFVNRQVVYRNLIVSNDATLGLLGTMHKVILTGNATATSTGIIGNVAALLSYCPPTILTGTPTCTTTNAAAFSEAALAQPINVVPGQIVQVRVEISFT